MHEIEFRRWDSINKVMLSHKEIPVLLKNVKNDSQFTYMQYTGEKDEKLRKIYGGDIFQQFNGRIGVIRYFNATWWIGNKAGVVGLNLEAGLGKVLGNATENSKLLAK